MSSISAVSPIPSAILTTPVQPIRPIAGKTAAPSTGFSDSDATSGAAKTQSANAPGVGVRLDITV
jgi:hypothetical protein